jgi:hypothetical protein
LTRLINRFNDESGGDASGYGQSGAPQPNDQRSTQGKASLNRQFNADIDPFGGERRPVGWMERRDP